MKTEHGYTVLFAIDEKQWPNEWEYIVAHRPGTLHPFVSWIRNKESGSTFHGWYCETFEQAKQDAIQRATR